MVSWACVSWPSIRSASTGWWRPTPSCRRGMANQRSLPQLAPVLPGGRALPGRHHRELRLHHRPRPGGGGRIRRALPRQHVRVRRPSIPTRAHRLGRPGGDRQPGGLEGARAVREAVPLCLQRQRPDHARSRCAAPANGFPVPPASRIRTIAGGGHFLQEDPGPSSPGRSSTSSTERQLRDPVRRRAHATGARRDRPAASCRREGPFIVVACRTRSCTRPSWGGHGGPSHGRRTRGRPCGGVRHRRGPDVGKVEVVGPGRPHVDALQRIEMVDGFAVRLEPAGDGDRVELDDFNE